MGCVCIPPDQTKGPDLRRFAAGDRASTISPDGDHTTTEGDTIARHLLSADAHRLIMVASLRYLDALAYD